jgi:hypothetical protein
MLELSAREVPTTFDEHVPKNRQLSDYFAQL